VRKRRGLTIVFVIAMAAMRPIVGIASEEQSKEHRELSVTSPAKASLILSRYQAPTSTYARRTKRPGCWVK
jgi:hypothetical protein